MSEANRSNYKFARTATVLAASAALLASCGGKQQTAEQKHRESVQAAYRYESSPARNALITAAVASFVKVVINQESLPKSKWGHIDLLCTSKTGVYGDVPLRAVKAGDDCTFSIGDSSGPLRADVSTDSLGVSGDHVSFDPNKVSDLSVDRLGNAECTAFFLYTPGGGWLANPTNGPAAWPESVNQVAQIDKKALDCLSATVATVG